MKDFKPKNNPYTHWNKDDEFNTFYGDIKYFFENAKLEKEKVIWLPFDDNDSNFVKYLIKEGDYDFVATHIQSKLILVRVNKQVYEFQLPENLLGDFYVIKPHHILKMLEMCNRKASKNDLIVISNPPFNGKAKVIRRLKEFDLNFALIFGIQCFNSGGFTRELKDLNNFQMIYLINRMKFFKGQETMEKVRN
ncbi:MAG: hypothetical protein E7Y34_02520, partial [Mycoplasma sp.]|nr:hypothetical protein [Mycoplasma sp.]